MKEASVTSFGPVSPLVCGVFDLAATFALSGIGVRLWRSAALYGLNISGMTGGRRPAAHIPRPRRTSPNWCLAADQLKYDHFMHSTLPCTLPACSDAQGCRAALSHSQKFRAENCALTELQIHVHRRFPDLFAGAALRGSAAPAVANEFDCIIEARQMVDIRPGRG
jgi:hypothetical protein